MIKTIGFPGRYLQGPDAVQHLPELLKEFSLTSPLVLMDDLVRESVGDLLLRPLAAAGIETTVLRFAGECTSEAIEQHFGKRLKVARSLNQMLPPEGFH
jgi:glycerol dehydrogenase